MPALVTVLSWAHTRTDAPPEWRRVCSRSAVVVVELGSGQGLLDGLVDLEVLDHGVGGVECELDAVRGL